MRYACKYAAKSGKHAELLNEVLEYLARRSTDILPPNMKEVLSKLTLANVSHRSFMSKQELSYRVMQLPMVMRSFTNVDVVGFYRRSYLNIPGPEGNTIVYSDRTEYSAYSERLRDDTVIVNRANARRDNLLTQDMLVDMSFRDFAESILHTWVEDEKVDPIEIDSRSSRKIKTRDIDSGHWELKRRQKRRHIRFSTILYTDAAYLYNTDDIDDYAVENGFFSLPLPKRKQLVRAYMELVCYVPWKDSPEESFLDEGQQAMLNDEVLHPEKEERYSLRRLELFFEVYKRRWDAGLVAPVGSQWNRDNQYSYSMFLSADHNIDIHEQRVENEGVLKATFEPADELEGTEVDIRYDISDALDDADFPSVMNFLPADSFRGIMEQEPPTLSELNVAFPLNKDWQALERLVKVNRRQLFMAQPPPSSVAYDDMTAIQKWAVDLGTDMNHQILYLCGKAGVGKSQVALAICERFPGRCQAGANCGKAAAVLGGPTIHGMFQWGIYDRTNDVDIPTVGKKKAAQLKVFYENTDVFVIDEINAVSADMLANLHDAMTTIFNPYNKKGPDGKDLPFGGKKMVFLGDPVQLKPVMGEPIYNDGDGGSSKTEKIRGSRGRRQILNHQTKKGQELYRDYLVPNCIFLQRGQRNVGLLQQICDRLRTGKLTHDDRCLLTYQRVHHPDFVTDCTVHYTNESCMSTNWRHLWSNCQAVQPPTRLYICRASYHTTDDNGQIVDALASLPPKMYNFAPDVLCVSIGCEVRLLTNINVAAGLVNSATGTVVSVVYDNADCVDLTAGKHPPPYCIIVDFPEFQGFLSKNGERVRPFEEHPNWIPIYREKFAPKRSSLSSWITSKQHSSDCWRIQFPLDLCNAITCHRAQGQTFSNCTLSVDLGLDVPDRPLQPEMCSILYVACTRVHRLQDLYVSPIYPGTWKQIMDAAGSFEMKKIEDKLRVASRHLAVRCGMSSAMKDELDWKPAVGDNDQELQLLKTMPAAQRNVPAPPVFTADDFKVHYQLNGSNQQFQMCLKPVQRERHIGLDQGRKNFAIVVVDKEIGQRPVIVAAENYDLDLGSRFSATDVLVKLRTDSELWNWMQQTDDSTLPIVDRVVVHLEQMSTYNAHWRQFGSNFGRILQLTVKDPSSCVVKMSQPHLLRAGGVIHHLGRMIVDELKLVPVTYKVKRRTVPQPSTSAPAVQPDDPGEGTSRPTPRKRTRNSPIEDDDVDMLDNEEGVDMVDDDEQLLNDSVVESTINEVETR